MLDSSLTKAVLLTIWFLTKNVFAAIDTKSLSNFTVINGQIFTPGLVVVDAPQPFTPLGGGMMPSTLHLFCFLIERNLVLKECIIPFQTRLT